jgi:hypothetical protein
MARADVIVACFCFHGYLYSAPVQPVCISVCFASAVLEARYLIAVFKKGGLLSLLKQIIYFTFYEEVSVA